MNVCVLNEVKNKLSLPINSEYLNDQKVDDTTYYKQMKRITLNVGGVRHEVLLKNLEKYPESRLGKIRFAKSLDEIKELCDDMNGDELFFDRSFNSFDTILNLYRFEKSRASYNKLILSIISLNDDFYYWGFEEFLDAEESGDDAQCSRKNIKNQLENKDLIKDKINSIDKLESHNLYSRRTTSMKISHLLPKSLKLPNSFRNAIWNIMKHPNCSAWSSRVRFIF